MNITIQKEDILPSLALIQNIVEKRTTLPILSHVLIEAPEHNHISLKATDLELGVRLKCMAMVEKTGACTTDARKLYEIIRSLSSEPLLLSLAENGWLKLKQGKSRFTFPTLDPKEFPAISTPPSTDSHTIRIPAALLKEMIEKTLFASSPDDTRLSLTGALLEANGGEKLRMVASDGHRLSLIERTIPNLPPSLPKTLLPRKGLTETRKILDLGEEEEATLSISGTLTALTYGSTEISIRPLDGEFPDYQQVIPQKSTHTVSLQREELLGAIRRLLLLTTERARGVKFKIETGKVDLSVNNPDLGEGMEEIGTPYEGSGVTIGFNGRYLIDVLSTLDKQTITLELNDDVSPGMIKAEDDREYLYVVMPMRIF